eukprot:TRINITY_DN4035_c0_g2_i3.p1 TRINITY_DN4035_c0_g2~~TRINITY_DN4035_c0_g2_i3.p1  ORF type:complete len:128 (+),score=25.81 TRINITY_DN4035_c0_g2_i3:885-1268(+)
MFAFLFYMVHEWFMYLIFGCTYILLMVLAVLLVPRESWSKTEADNDYGLVDEEGSASNQTSLMPDRRGSDVLRFFLSVPYLFLLFFSVVLLCKNTLEWEEVRPFFFFPFLIGGIWFLGGRVVWYLEG